MKKIFTLISALALVSAASAQLTTVPVTDVEQMVLNNLVANGINVTNIAYTGDTSSIAEFDCNGCDLGLGSGVLLSTGNASGVSGPASIFISTGLGQPGDVDLASLSTGSTFDATVLEFDYQIATDTVEISFVFASEEYNEYVNTPFNDIFAFFVSGQGINNENIALVPGDTIPVAINNVNNGNSPVGVPSSGPCTNCQYFDDNTGGTTVTFDASTTIITAKRTAIPGTVYHMKLAIADVGDGIFDSGVFIAGNSVGAKGTAPIYINSQRIAETTTINKCESEIITITAPTGGTYLWSTGETTQSIDAIQDGVYKLDLSFGGNATAISDSVIIVNSFAGSAQPVITINSGILSSNYATGNQWFFDGQLIPGATEQTLIPTGVGNYSVQVTDVNTGCVSDMSAPFVLTSITGLTQEIPFTYLIDNINSTIKIDVKPGFNGTAKIYNVLGAEIINTEIKAGETIMNLPVGGVYFLNLITEKGIYSEKIVVN